MRSVFYNERRLCQTLLSHRKNSDIVAWVRYLPFQLALLNSRLWLADSKFQNERSKQAPKDTFKILQSMEGPSNRLTLLQPINKHLTADFEVQDISCATNIFQNTVFNR